MDRLRLGDVIDMPGGKAIVYAISHHEFCGRMVRCMTLGKPRQTYSLTSNVTGTVLEQRKWGLCAWACDSRADEALKTARRTRTERPEKIYRRIAGFHRMRAERFRRMARKQHNVKQG